ncbi:MAG: polymer-forming cytoskeletal protein [Deltaproteobacteria bacterium]|nr:MAG: polymer-forming cytoskeletal protein [Deltaproteobacteria bacterium]
MQPTIGPDSQKFSLFGKGSKIKGTFHLRGLTRLSSIVEGEIIMEDDEDLSIEREGEVKGLIKCFNLNIYGQFDGEVEARGKVTIYPSASFSGKLNASSISIHPGAKINMEGHTLL